MLGKAYADVQIPLDDTTFLVVGREAIHDSPTLVLQGKRLPDGATSPLRLVFALPREGARKLAELILTNTNSDPTRKTQETST